jgi:intracellular septation protein
MANENPGGSNRRAWVRGFVDYAAPLAFAVAFFGAPLLGVPAEERFMLATGVLVAASVIALTVGFVVERRVAPLPLFAGGLAVIFGGLTLAFDDDRFVKMKVTVVNGLLAAALLGGFALKRNFMRPLFGEAIRLSEAAWRSLMIRYGLWFTAVAIANEVVWRTQSDAAWVTFRTALLPAAIVFSLLQLPFMMRHMEKDAPKPPEPGF